MTSYSGVTWRVDYGEISEREQFRVGRLSLESYDAYFPLSELTDLIDTLTAVTPLGLNMIVRGSKVQAVKVSDGLLTSVVISPRLDTGTPVESMRLPLSELTDLLYALSLFRADTSALPDDWDFSKPNPINEAALPKYLQQTELSATIGVVEWKPTEGATAAQNRVSLQAAVDAAVASGLVLRLPAGTTHIAGGHVNVTGKLRVIGGSFGPSATVLHQDTKGKAIFKVSAADCAFDGFTFEGEGLDVTGLPLNGAASFRQHVGVWATLTAHRLSVTNVVSKDIVTAVVIGDFLPGETPTYSSSGLTGLILDNIRCVNVWVGVGGGPVIDPIVTNITGDYTYCTGTPSNGDVGSPPHLVYFSSDTAHPSAGGFYDKIAGSNVSVAGGVLKLKHMSGVAVGAVIARNTRGILEMEEVTDFTVESLVSTGDGYLDTGSAYGRGSVWLVGCKNGTIRGINITFATGTHGSAVWTNSGCEDLIFERPVIVARRSTDTATVFAMLDQGKRTRVVDPQIRSEGATILSGLATAGLDQVIRRPRVSGAFTNAVSGANRRALIEYDPVDILPSRLVVPSRSFQVSGAPASEQPIFRDVSVGQALPSGFSDDFNVAGRLAMSWTDDHKRWQVAGVEGPDYGTWRVTSGKAIYDGGSARSFAFVDAVKADGVLTFVVGAVPNGDEGVLLRYQDKDNYIAVVPYAGAGDYRLRIIKRVAGAASQTAISTVQAAPGDTGVITLVGTSISVTLNGSPAVSGTVAEFTTATKFGLMGISTGKTFSVSSMSFA